MTDWQQSAACKGKPASLFYWYTQSEQAKAVCRSCPVQADCLTHALETGEEHGVWGGLDEVERVKLREKRRRGGSQKRPIQHGTKSGYQAHQRRGQRPCDECRWANACWWRENRNQGDVNVTNREIVVEDGDVGERAS